MLKIFGYKIKKDDFQMGYTIEKGRKFVGIAQNKADVLEAIREDMVGINEAEIDNLVFENKNIELSELAYKKLRYYTSACPNDEISGLGTVKVNGDIYLVEDVFIFQQESHAAGTVLSKDDIARFMAEWIKGGKDPSNLRLWWHSHGNGMAFWSKIDTQNIDKFNSDDFMVSIVLTSGVRQMLGRIDFYQPERKTIDELLPILHFEDDPKLKFKCQKEAEKKNRRPIYVQTKLHKAIRYPQSFSLAGFY
jgi:hypothetical protein